MTYLLETENKTLVEASFDDIWGTGIHIASRDALTMDKWRSIGLLGKILMGVRDRQKESTVSTIDRDIHIDDPETDCSCI